MHENCKQANLTHNLQNSIVMIMEAQIKNQVFTHLEMKKKRQTTNGHDIKDKKTYEQEIMCLLQQIHYLWTVKILRKHYF